MTRLLGYYTVQAPWTFVYMLQQSEYSPRRFLKWFVSYPNLLTLQKRGRLELTSRAKLMLAIAYFAWAVGFIKISFLAIWFNLPMLFFGLLLLPVFCALSIFLTTLLLQTLVVSPSENKQINRAKAKLSAHKATKIAVMGSYGKTSMKEILVTVLGQAKKVAATPGNKNVLISHARWVNRELEGDEDVLIFEYGEAKPGDIAKLAKFSQPQIAVITGLAPAHLDGYKNLEAVADDFAQIQKQKYLEAGQTYINDNEILKHKLKGKHYSSDGLDDWKVSEIKVDFSGTSFTLSNKTQKLQLKSGLLGAHQIGPLVVAVDIAFKLGLTKEQVIKGIAKTKPFEHRMEPRQLHGAWIIDDSYNGNIEGMKAGLELLKTLPAKRTIYVTPGLVDQGEEAKNVHNKLGSLIADANPTKVVLMKNSVTELIRSGMQSADYKGELQIENNPLEYYTNLEKFLASGDVVMLQNDWPDSYH